MSVPVPDPARRLAAALLAALLGCAAPAAAQVAVTLRDGRRFRGELLRQGRTVLVLRTVKGIVVDLPADELASVAEVSATTGPASRPAGAGGARPVGPAEGRGEHSSTCPAGCPACERLFARSLDRLCARVLRRPADRPIPIRLGAWPAVQAPASSVLGLVLLGEGAASRRGPRRRALLRLTRYVAGAAARDDRFTRAHRTWTVALATLFLAEMHAEAPSPALRGRIWELARLLQAGRQGERGWCHSLRPAGYGPFVGVTLWSTAALGAARREGVEVGQASLDAAFAGLRGCIGPSGGASYWVRHGSSVSVGRTGGVAWVLSTYPLPGAEGDNGRKSKLALNFLLRHIEGAPHGHASGLMNFAWAALGAASFGPNERRVFWQAHRRTLLGARGGDGTFAVQPWKDLGYGYADDSMPPVEARGTTWPDRTYGDGWATVWMLLSWQVGRGRCVLVSGNRGER